ncbi:MAG: hypothetical protein ACLFSZ_10695, partial [Puniceicoccaceae bacterium]
PWSAAQENPFIPTEANSWVPDLSGPLDAESPIDLRALNETAAGEHGFLRLSEDGRSFVRGDGEPIRFWAVHASTYPKNWSDDDHRDYARGLARMGVNLALAGALPRPAPDQDDPTKVDPKVLDDLWKRVAVLKDQGIYSTVRGTWFYGFEKFEMGIEGYAPGAKMTNVVFFSPRLQEIYKAWVRQMLTLENPYTGVPLAEETAVASFTFFNEDSPLFFTLASLKGEPLRNAQTLFGTWAAAEYGSLEKAIDAWGGTSAEGDDLAAGRLGLLNWWFASEEGRKSAPGNLPRIRAQARFIAEHQRDFYAEMTRWLREDIGAKQLILTSNFRPAVPETMTDLEQWVKAQADVIAGNSYPGSSTLIGKNKGWQVSEGQFMQFESITRAPLEMPQVQRQVAGHPFWISETLWPHPHEYANEGPLLSAIYANVTGQTAASFAGPRAVRWDGDSLFLPFNRALMSRWNCSEPAQMGAFPAAALIARFGYGSQDRPAVVEHRSFDEITSLKPPLLAPGADFDPNQDGGDGTHLADAAGALPPEAFLMGAVLADFSEGETTVAPEVRAYDGGDLIASLDGTVRCDRKTGIITLDTPEAQSVVGFLKNAGRVTLSTLSVESANEHLGITAIALDRKPLAESGKIFVQISPRARPTGWKLEAATHQEKDGPTLQGWRITDTGEAPFRLETIQGRIAINNPGLTTATALDPLGQPGDKLPLKRDGATASLTLPTSAIYLILD